MKEDHRKLKTDSLLLFTSYLLPLTFYLLPLTFYFSCASTDVFSPVPLLISEDIAGIAHAGFSNSPEEYALLDRLGVSWTLRTFSWRRIQPEEGQWDFSNFDEYVDIANAAGIKVLGVLAYDAPWIHEGGSGPRYIPPDKTHYFLEYVRRTVEHFRGRVDAWCIWNEPNSTRFWAGTREGFFTLSRLAADAVREVDPDVVLLGGAFNRGVLGLPNAFIRGLFESGAMENVDAVAFHPYELNPARTARLYGRFSAIAAEYGFADRIWTTEVGYPTGGWYPTKTTEKKFPAFVIKTFINLAISDTKTVIWYQLFDSENRVRSNSEHFFGLVRGREDFISKGAEAFRLCAMYLPGTVYYPHRPLRENLPSSLKTFYFETPSITADGESSGRRTLVLWKDGSAMRVAMQIPGSNHTIHDPVSGDAVAIQSDAVIRVGSMPVFVTWDAGGDSASAVPFSGPLRLFRAR